VNVAQPSIDTLVREFRTFSKGGDASRLDSWTERDWRLLLLDLPVDSRALWNRFQAPLPEQITRIRQRWTDGKTAPSGGYLGLYLLTLIALHHSDRMRFGGPDPLDACDIDRLCKRLVQDTQVRQAIRILYDPCWKGDKKLTKRSTGYKEIAPNVIERWENIDFEKLEFHRSGTTSIIFKGVTKNKDSNGAKPTFALKCLIYPFQQIEAISKATRKYREDYQLDARQIEGIKHLVPVWASYDAWIIMTYVKGDTLGETLAEAEKHRSKPRRDIARTIDLDQLDRLGTALLDALAELESKNRYHGDLSPSNIIVEDPGGEETVAKLRLIDLGVNYLHTRSMPGRVDGDAAYVAPETRNRGDGGDDADLYSIGRLLIAIGGVPPNPDGTVPDAFYLDSVGLARLLEDLVDADPERRLMVLGADGPLKRPEKAPTDAPGSDAARKVKRIPHIKRRFKMEIKVAKAAKLADERGLLAGLKRFTPGQGLVKRQTEILKVLDDLPEYEDVAGEDENKNATRSEKIHKLRKRLGIPKGPEVPDTVQAFHHRQARRLHVWALVCSWCVFISFGLIIMWWGRDINFSWQLKPIELVLNVLQYKGDRIPVLDALRAADYPIHDFLGSLPARLVALSFILAGARWYLNVLADLTPRTQWKRTGRTRVLTVFNDAAMRSAAVLPAVYVTVPTLIDRDWWPLFTAIGVTTVATVNTGCLLFARDAIDRARERQLSTVPGRDTTAMEKFAPWAPTSWMYAVPVWSIAILLLLDLLHDELVYAVFVTIINLAMWYVIKTGIEAPYVRVALTRSYLAAERLDALDRREAEDAQKPPAARDAAEDAVLAER
jgi:serine/threonine protein kinase